MLLTILGIVGSILTILIWLGSAKRKAKSKMRKVKKQIGRTQRELNEAIHNNDTVNISVLSERVRKLRKEYRHLSNRSK